MNERDAARDDLLATAESAREDAERIARLEADKLAELEADEPDADELRTLTAQVSGLAAELGRKARAEADLASELPGARSPAD